MLRLNSSVVNLRLERKDLKLLWLNGNAVYGTISDEGTFLFQNVNGHRLVSLNDDSMVADKSLFESAEKALRGTKVYSADDVFWEKWKYSSYALNCFGEKPIAKPVEGEYILVDDPSGKKTIFGKPKQVKQQKWERVGTNYELTVIDELWNQYPRDDCRDAIKEAALSKNVDHEWMNQYHDSRDSDNHIRGEMVMELLKPTLQWKLFERTAEAKSDKSVAFTEASLWQATLVEAVLSQQESADKLSKRFKVSLEWSGKFEERAAGEYALSGTNLEDLITKSTHKEVDG